MLPLRLTKIQLIFGNKIRERIQNIHSQYIFIR